MQQLRESTCDYDSFVRDFCELVEQMMGNEYSTRIYKVIANNSAESDSLVLFKSGSSFAPGIFLYPYYKEYLKGADICQLAAKVCDKYRSRETAQKEEAFTYDFENIKDRIVYRLINYNRNRKLLEAVPHIKYMDLAVTYHCLFYRDDSGISAIRITNDHLNLWKCSVKELHPLAAKNTLREFPPVISCMNDIIQKMFDRENGEDDGCSSQMYVLSNSIGVYGAACLLYKNLLRDFSAKHQADVFVLPSSIHELILIPDRGNVDRDELVKMVKSINRTHLAYDEVLSDRVYYYSRGYNAIMQ